MANKTNEMVKKYRFFYHFYKQKGKMSIHFKDTCQIVDNVVCKAECETKWNKTQPRLVMRGFATNVVIKDGVGYIE